LKEEEFAMTKAKPGTAPMTLRIGVGMMPIGCVILFFYGFHEFRERYYVAIGIWWAFAFLLTFVGLWNTASQRSNSRSIPEFLGGGIPPEYDPEKHRDPPTPFHVMGGVPWEGTLSTSEADRMMRFVRRLFRPQRERR
jgi:hypothetical protein